MTPGNFAHAKSCWEKFHLPTSRFLYCNVCAKSVILDFLTSAALKRGKKTSLTHFWSFSTLTCIDYWCFYFVYSQLHSLSQIATESFKQTLWPIGPHILIWNSLLAPITNLYSNQWKLERSFRSIFMKHLFTGKIANPKSIKITQE